MDKLLATLDATREEAINNIRKNNPEMSKKEVGEQVNNVQKYFINVLSKRDYLRYYCENCRTTWGHQSIGQIDTCDKCGKRLIVKSFYPWSKCFNGLAIMLLGLLTWIFHLP